MKLLILMFGVMMFGWSLLVLYLVWKILGKLATIERRIFGAEIIAIKRR